VRVTSAGVTVGAVVTLLLRRQLSPLSYPVARILLTFLMGVLYSAYSQTFPPAAKWGVDDIPDLTGRVVVVTGGYAGIGTWTVKVGICLD
jgi:hypothetical protein